MNSLIQKNAAPQSALPEEESQDSLNTLPSAEDYAASARARMLWFLLGGALLAGVVATAFVADSLDNIFLPLAVLIGVLTPILLWRFPRFSLCFILAAACLFELGLVSAPDGGVYKDALTDRVPFFWNINTIFQIYGHTDFKAIPLNLFEVFIVIAGVCSCLRAVYTNTANLRVGALFPVILIYLLFVVMGWINGVLEGGDFKISLQEIRPEFYFALAYLIAVNTVRERKDIETLLWITVLCIGLKAILMTFRRYVTLQGQPLPDQGVGMHEEAYFFDSFALLLLCLSLCKVMPRLQAVMWSLLPFIVMGNLILNRRAATAAILIVLPLLLLAAYRALPERRRLIAVASLVAAVGFSIYYPAFKNSDSIFAQPARAIRSNFQPDPRDASSNEARDAENLNLMTTIKSAPLRGNGYGCPYLHVVPMADITNIYALEDYLPHNQILWVWERVGTFGFLAFWIMVSTILIFAGQIIRRPEADQMMKAVGIFAMVMMTMQIIFGLLDLQLTNLRDVIFTGVWIGVLAVVPTLPTEPQSAQRSSRTNP